MSAFDPVALVEQAHQQLDDVAARFTFVEALQAELELRTRGGLAIRNECIWDAMLSTRDMAVVHFGEWVGATKNEGLIPRLSSCVLSRLFVSNRLSNTALSKALKSMPNTSGVPLRFHKPAVEQAHRFRWEAFQRLFPNAAAEDRTPTKDDLKELRERFGQQLDDVKTDRDEHRAHPPYGVKPQSPRAEMLSFGAIRECLEWAHQFLKDLRVVLDETGRSALREDPERHESAADIVDLMLFGSKRTFDMMTGISAATHSAERKYAWQYRGALYEELSNMAGVGTPDSSFSGDLPETKGWLRVMEHHVSSSTKGKTTDEKQEWAGTNEQLFDYWSKCEDIAVHFNELIIKMRTQSLGALAALAAIIGWAGRGSENEAAGGAVAFAFVALLVVWTAVGLIDFLYYGRLLKGAVEEIKRIETLSGGKFQLSLAIDEACGIPREDVSGWTNRVRWGRVFFYALPAMFLAGSAFYFACGS